MANYYFNISLLGRTHALKYMVVVIALSNLYCNYSEPYCLQNKEYNQEKLDSLLDTESTLVLFKYKNCIINNFKAPTDKVLEDYLIKGDSFLFNRSVLFVTYLDSGSDGIEFIYLVDKVHKVRQMAYDKVSIKHYGIPFDKLKYPFTTQIILMVNDIYGRGPYPGFFDLNSESYLSESDIELMNLLTMRLLYL